MRAMANAQHEAQMRADLTRSTSQFIHCLGTKAPELDKGTRLWLAEIGDVVTRARSPVSRGGYTREIQYVPDPELPARFARQLSAMQQGVLLVTGVDTAGITEVAPLARVAWDCIPTVRRRILRILYERQGQLQTGQIAESAQLPSNTTRIYLEDLQALRMVACEKAGQGAPTMWALRRDARDGIRAIWAPAGDPEAGLGQDTPDEPRLQEALPLAVN